MGLTLRAAVLYATALATIEKAKAGGWKTQARVPQGNPKGGQWTTWGSGGWGGALAEGAGAFIPQMLTGANPNNSALVSANKAIAGYAKLADKGDVQALAAVKPTDPGTGGNSYTKAKWANWVEAHAYAQAKTQTKATSNEMPAKAAAAVTAPGKTGSKAETDLVVAAGTADIVPLKSLTKIGEKPGGSAKGAMYLDATGGKWLVKEYPDSDQARSEVLAAKLYGLTSVKAPTMALVDVGGGKLGVASRWVDGMSQMGSSPSAALKAKVQEGFAADAWLANWDVVGLSYDNITVDKAGNPYRIDPGGALDYRAMGGKKGAAFGTSVTEWDSLRGLDPTVKNGEAKAIFGDMTAAQLTQSALNVAAIPDVWIKDTVAKWGPGSDADRAALADKLIARRDDILARAGALHTKKATTTVDVATAALATGKVPEAPGKAAFSTSVVTYDQYYGPKVNALKAMHAKGDIAGLESEINALQGKIDGTALKKTKANYVTLQNYATGLLGTLGGTTKAPDKVKDPDQIKTVQATTGTVAKPNAAILDLVGTWAVGSPSGKIKAEIAGLENIIIPAAMAKKLNDYQIGDLAKIDAAVKSGDIKNPDTVLQVSTPAMGHYAAAVALALEAPEKPIALKGGTADDMLMAEGWIASMEHSAKYTPESSVAIALGLKNNGLTIDDFVGLKDKLIVPGVTAGTAGTTGTKSWYDSALDMGGQPPIFTGQGYSKTQMEPIEQVKAALDAGDIKAAAAVKHTGTSSASAGYAAAALTAMGHGDVKLSTGWTAAQTFDDMIGYYKTQLGYTPTATAALISPTMTITATAARTTDAPWKAAATGQPPTFSGHDPLNAQTAAEIAQIDSNMNKGWAGLVAEQKYTSPTAATYAAAALVASGHGKYEMTAFGLSAADNFDVASNMSKNKIGYENGTTADQIAGKAGKVTAPQDVQIEGVFGGGIMSPISAGSDLTTWGKVPKDIDWINAHLNHPDGPKVRAVAEYLENPNITGSGAMYGLLKLAESGYGHLSVTVDGKSGSVMDAIKNHQWLGFNKGEMAQFGVKDVDAFVMSAEAKSAASGKGGIYTIEQVAEGNVAVGSMPAMGVSQAAMAAMPDFKKALLPDTNSNATSHNAKVATIEGAAKAGDIQGILNQTYGSNTYGKQQAKLANDALVALGHPPVIKPGMNTKADPAKGTYKPSPGFATTVTTQTGQVAAKPPKAQKVTITTADLPPKPTFVTSKLDIKAQNEGHANTMYALALAGDIPGLKAYDAFSPLSSKLVDFKAELIASIDEKLNPGKVVTFGTGTTAQAIAAAVTAAKTVAPIKHEQIKAWGDKAADYVVLSKGGATSIPKPAGFQEVTAADMKKYKGASDLKYQSAPSSLKSALSSYTGSAYDDWNNVLRTGTTTDPKYAKAKQVADAFKEYSTVLPSGITLWRGIGVGENTYKHIIGDIIQDGSFQSASYGSQPAFSTKKTWLKIHVSEGVKAMMATTFSKFGSGESEVILAPNVRYAVMGVSKQHMSGHGMKTVVELIALPHET